jgi:hypothetical protein
MRMMQQAALFTSCMALRSMRGRLYDAKGGLLHQYTSAADS